MNQANGQRASSSSGLGSRENNTLRFSKVCKSIKTNFLMSVIIFKSYHKKNQVLAEKICEVYTYFNSVPAPGFISIINNNNCS